MRLIDRVDNLQRRRPVLGFPIAVLYKFFDDAGGYLSALLTYYAFVSLFPLLLLLATILSVVLRNHPGWQQDVLNSALSQFPIVGGQLGDPKSLSGGTTGVIVGGLVSLYGALGVGNALQYTMNTVWAVPRNSRPNPLLARLRSLLLVVIAGIAVMATTVISAFASATTGWGLWHKVLIALATIIINTGIVLLCFRIGVGSVRRRQLLPGSVLAAVGWQALQTFGVVYVGRVVKHASATNGVVSFILGLLAFIYLASVIVVISAEMSAVRAGQLYPRALLTPFTDAVSLTPADKKTYANQARAMRTKGYERIDVTFEDR
ncbi:MAG: YihY/virulence factor BrkB family protein, partial [Nostocoides sp.]